MSFVIPVKRLRETNRWIVFRLPQPAYPFHVMLVSKRAFPSLIEIPGEGAPAILKDLILIVQSLVLISPGRWLPVDFKWRYLSGYPYPPFSSDRR
jgi:hypothetical protein